VNDKESDAFADLRVRRGADAEPGQCGEPDENNKRGGVA
jgi:hypothetical protein